MDKLERAGYTKKLIKLYRKQGKSAKEARRLAGEAVRVQAQGEAWQARAKRKEDKQESLLNRATTTTQDGITIHILPAKGTRIARHNHGCRVLSRAKTVSNALWMDVATGKGRSKAAYKGQTSDNLALTITVSADNVKQARHLRACNLVIARRYCKRLAEKD